MSEPRLHPEEDPRYPDSPREAVLRKQLRDVQTRMHSQKESFDEQMAGLRGQLERQRIHYEGLFNSHIRQIKSELPALRKANQRLTEENQALRVAVDAGIGRRADMMYLLNLLVTTDDNEALDDIAYDRTLDMIVKKARGIISLERLAREKTK